MKINDIINEDGRIVQGVNTTVDVKPGETERQAKKFFGGDGKPKPLGVKGATPNQAFNLGLVESLQEDMGSIPPLPELILMAIAAKTTVDILIGSFKVAVKTGKGLKKLNDLRKRVVGAGERVADYAMPHESMGKDEYVKKFANDQKNRFYQAALDALHHLVTTDGGRGSIGGHAFDIARAFNGINAKELEQMYTKKDA